MKVSRVGFKETCSKSELSQFRQIGVPGIAAKRQVGELAPAVDFDQAGGSEFLQMMGERGRTDGKDCAQVRTCRAGLGGDPLQKLEAVRIGENAGNEAHFARR